MHIREEKRQLKAKAKTDAAKAEMSAQDSTSKKEIEPSDPGEYYKHRVAMINERREKGENPFPHKFDVTISLTDFIEKFGNEVTENGKVLTDESVRVAGTFPYHFCR